MGTVTIGSKGQIVIPKAARETFEHEKQKQEDLGLHCEVTIDGYTDFIFINRFGQGTAPSHKITQFGGYFYGKKKKTAHKKQQ